MVPAHEFLRRLVRDPRFPPAFQDIVVEFGNPRYQGVMDRYIAGERPGRGAAARVAQRV